MPAKIAWSDLEQPRAGPKGAEQDARSSARLRRCAQVIAQRFSSGVRSALASVESLRKPRQGRTGCCRGASPPEGWATGFDRAAEE